MPVHPVVIAAPCAAMAAGGLAPAVDHGAPSRRDQRYGSAAASSTSAAAALFALLILISRSCILGA